MKRTIVLATPFRKPERSRLEGNCWTQRRFIDGSGTEWVQICDSKDVTGLTAVQIVQALDDGTIEFILVPADVYDAHLACIQDGEYDELTDRQFLSTILGDNAEFVNKFTDAERFAARHGIVGGEYNAGIDKFVRFDPALAA